MTHVPLWRPENSDCGPRRRHPPLRNLYGYQYQSNIYLIIDMIQFGIAKRVVDIVKPRLIISGDDHDSCIYNHTAYGYPVKEHSIPTFSWLQGNIYPAFGMLALRDMFSPGSDNQDLSLEECALPPQMLVYFWYIFSGIVCIIGVIVYSRLSYKKRFQYERVGLNNHYQTNVNTYTRSRLVEFLVFIFVVYTCCLFIEWFI